MNLRKNKKYICINDKSFGYLMNITTIYKGSEFIIYKVESNNDMSIDGQKIHQLTHVHLIGDYTIEDENGKNSIKYKKNEWLRLQIGEFKENFISKVEYNLNKLLEK